LCLLSLLLPSLGVIGLENSVSFRAVVAISRVLSTDFSDFLPSLSMLDPSLGSRLITNFASFQTPLFSTFGLGLDCQSVPTAYNILEYSFVSTNEVLSQAMVTGCLKPQSYGAAVALSMGLMSLPFVVFLFMAIRTSSFKYRRQLIWKPALAICLVMLFVQIQITNPIPWMLAYFAIFRPKSVFFKR
jgi:hypothetical protein